MSDLNRTEESSGKLETKVEQLDSLLKDFLRGSGVREGNRLIRFLLKEKDQWGLLTRAYRLREIQRIDSK
jgi:hypothetical protein